MDLTLAEIEAVMTAIVESLPARGFANGSALKAADEKLRQEYARLKDEEEGNKALREFYASEEYAREYGDA